MDPVVSRPGEGEVLSKPHRELRVKALIPELNLLEYDVGPEYDGAGPHYHEWHADSFYVLEGELEFQVGEETIRAPAGTSVVVPPGVVHAFTNASGNRARFLNVHAPESRFVEYLAARDRGDDVDSAAYDIFDVE
ncbi:MAG TPA: cupin domain-containing protein [Gaiellaceae bacterium]|jgi:mannose-6-phosphate isomerase-like protein (cupin superfamily)|nr:cupin domain-containing protein [Gaiellaceae bacterium]